MERPATALKAAIYCRISSDPEGKALGVDRQREDCAALVERMGWTVAEVFAENDVSASERSRHPRPLYADMIARARAGEFGALVAYSNSRLTRRFREFTDLIELAEQRGVRIVTVVSGEDDLSTADGRMTARIKASVDVAEAERTSERARRAKSQRAADGLYRGGMRPYGYEADGVTVREDEAGVIREAATAILAGRSLKAVAKELNGAGRQAVRLVRVEGAPRSDQRRVEVRVDWNYASLKDVLIRPRNAGLLASGRAGRSTETFTVVGRAVWPAVLEEETWRAVLDLLTDPARRKQQGNALAWFGSGIYRCGRCGSPMRHAPYARRFKDGTRGERRHLYRCSGDTAHLTINAAPTDEHVKKVVAEMCRDPRVVAAMTGGDEALLAAGRERRAVLAASLARTERDYDEDLIDARTRKRKVEKIEAEMVEIDQRLADGAKRTATGAIFAAPDPGAAFLAAPLDLQRAVVSMVVGIEVLPRLTRGGVWTPERLRITPAAGGS